MKMPSTSVLDLVWKLALDVQLHRWLPPKASCPSAELGLPLSPAAGSTRGPGQAGPGCVCPGRAGAPAGESLFQERTSHACSPGLLLFNASVYKSRDLEMLVQLLSCYDGALC